MTVQDDKAAGQTEEDGGNKDEGRADGSTSEKPEPDEDDKKAAAEMMSAFEERPTVVLPGSGGAVSGTAVNDWLDEDGKPKFNNEVEGVNSDDGPSDEDKQAQIEKDMALNDELRKAAAEDDKGEKR
ncbi:hypothetical protein MRAB57_4003 [Mycobacterium rhizamassiliense]|jgi:hypothetical protein|uniref:Uncharacterized protein n=1 Tax=Mycobacterium rhizamassiliense TaxID=1841860 RepID=A0A2U3NXE6_9MYCO|nr:hypothetical protein [Mycobacterium rhizamassiliense]SPM36164.1 hypothetical protein MRAB57_4003 [Mycobacterium rhizamassiliense]